MPLVYIKSMKKVSHMFVADLFSHANVFLAVSLRMISQIYTIDITD